MCTDHTHTRHWYGGNRTSEHQDGLRVCDAAILRSTDGLSPASLAQHGTAPHGKAHTDCRAHPFPADAVAGRKPRPSSVSCAACGMPLSSLAFHFVPKEAIPALVPHKEGLRGGHSCDSMQLEGVNPGNTRAGLSSDL